MENRKAERVLQDWQTYTCTNSEGTMANDLHLVVVTHDVKIKNKGPFTKGRVVDREVTHEGKPTSRVEFSGADVPDGDSADIELENDSGEIEILGYSWTFDGSVIGTPNVGAPT